MQLVIDIQNDTLAKKILQILAVFKNDGVKIKAIEGVEEDQNEPQEYDVDYEKSFQYKLDKADFIAMKKTL